jgi:hypothetical protein
MNKNSKEITKDKLNSGPSTTGSLGSSTDANITASSAGPEEEDSHGLFINLNTNKKHT